MRIIFSRDRAAQLDLLLRSMERNLPPEPTTVIWFASTRLHEAAYTLIPECGSMTTERWFNQKLRKTVAMDDRVSFFCDDDLVFQTAPHDPYDLLEDTEILCVNLNVGRQIRHMPMPPGFPVWHWKRLPRRDFGYPCGVDGRYYRSEDVQFLLGGEIIRNPTWVETAMDLMADKIARKRPKLACFHNQLVVGIPVNRVSPSSGVKFGEHHYQDTETLAKAFLSGYRIHYDSLDITRIRTTHKEIRFKWKLMS